jgi:hypothetical protein
MVVESHFPLNRRPWNHVRRVRLDLDGAIVGHKGPQGTSTVLQVEIDDPLEVAARFGEEYHPPLKIRFRRVDAVQRQLKIAALQPQKWHSPVKDGHIPGQDHDLLARWGRLLKEKSGSGLQTLQLVLWKGE